MGKEDFSVDTNNRSLSDILFLAADQSAFFMPYRFRMYRIGVAQLRQVRDSVNAANYSDDIDTQADTSNYHYDSTGNLVKDSSENIKNIIWNVYGKISEIHNATDTIRYTYDAGGSSNQQNSME